MCSEEVPISADIRPPDDFIDDDPYIPPGTSAKSARVEPNTYRYVGFVGLTLGMYGVYSRTKPRVCPALFGLSNSWT